MKLFISYGHKDYSAFVNRFILDLSEKHIVWTDKNILLGGKWVQDIDDNIKNCEIFIFLMAKDSIRRDSYCLNEIILAKDLKKRIIVIILDNLVKPSILAQDQHFSFESCLEYNGDIDENEYIRAFADFNRQINHFKEANTWEKKLPLKHFDNQKYANALLAEFTGGEWIMNPVNNWLAGSSSYLALIGAAGSGKSSLSAYIHKNIPGSILHFCKYTNERSTEIRLILQSIAVDLASVSPGYNANLSQFASCEKNMEGSTCDDIFEDLFETAASQISDSPIIIIIDGLDEITSNRLYKDFIRIIFKRFNDEIPSKFRFIFSSRNERRITTNLTANNVTIIHALEKRVTPDIKLYVSSYFHKNNITYSNDCLDKILHQSEGDFLYVKFILDELRLRNTTDVTRIIFPIGMKGVCQAYFDRIFIDDEDEVFKFQAKPLLELLCNAKDFMDITYVGDLLNLDSDNLNLLIKKMDIFLSVKNDSLMISHKSIYDWMYNVCAGDDYFVDLRKGKENLLKHITSGLSSDNPNHYVLEYGFEHLVEAKMFSTIATILTTENDSVITAYENYLIREVARESEFTIFEVFNILCGNDYLNYITFITIITLIQYNKDCEVERILDYYRRHKNYNILLTFNDFFKARNNNADCALIVKHGQALTQHNLPPKVLGITGLILGDGYRVGGDIKTAAEYYRLSSQIATEHHITTLYFDCECALIDLEYVVGNINAALTRLNKIKEFLNFDEPGMNLYKYYRLLGNIYSIKHNFPEAVKNFTECLKIAQSLSFPLKMIQSYNSIAESTTDYRSAVDNIMKSREVYKQLHSNTLEYGKGYYIQAEAMFGQQLFTEAESIINQGIDILTKVGYGSGIARCHLVKGKILAKTGKYVQAATHLELALNYYIKNQIYPSFRLEAHWYLVKSLERIPDLTGQSQKIYDNIDYFNYLEFDYLKDKYEELQKYY